MSRFRLQVEVECIIVHCEHFIMEGYLTNYSCTDSGTTMHSVLCIFGLLAGNIFQQQFYSAWYTWNVLLKSICLCCAFRYHFLAWGMLQEALSVWAAALQKAVCHLCMVEGGQCTRYVSSSNSLISMYLYNICMYNHIISKHCQRHNGPEGWVHITRHYTNLDRTIN